MNNKKELNQENEEPRIPTYQKFFALSGVMAEITMAARTEVLTSATSLDLVSGVGLAFLGIILGKHINKENSIKKAAFLLLGGTALTVVGIAAGFDQDPIKNAFLAIPTVLRCASLSMFVNRFEQNKKSKIQ